MKATITINDKVAQVDFSQPLDISIPLRGKDPNPLAWYQDLPKISPVIMGDFVGSVASGTSSTNFNNIFFNPHAHGTHTECLGHITRDFYSINTLLKNYMCVAQLISVTPEFQNGDAIIHSKMLSEQVENFTGEALIIRTLPNDTDKLAKNYSHTNPPYLTQEAAHYLAQKGIKHLLIDLPSVDKEKDDGLLLAHKAFWNVKNTTMVNDDAYFDRTITEMIFVPDEIMDGIYLLNLQIAAFENDASPSKPILYSLKF